MACKRCEISTFITFMTSFCDRLSAQGDEAKNILKKEQQQRCEHRSRKNKQIKSTVHDANKKK